MLFHSVFLGKKLSGRRTFFYPDNVTSGWQNASILIELLLFSNVKESIKFREVTLVKDCQEACKVVLSKMNIRKVATSLAVVVANEPSGYDNPYYFIQKNTIIAKRITLRDDDRSR